MLNPRAILSNEGRVDRLTWWIWCILFPIILLLFTRLFSYFPPDSIHLQIIGFVILGVLFIELIIFIVVSVKRLHDTDKSGYYLLLAIIPLINWILLYYLAFQKGTIGINKYGEELRKYRPPSSTKICPYCAEKIKSEAIVCRYCGRDLPLLRNNEIQPTISENKNKTAVNIQNNIARIPLIINEIPETIGQLVTIPMPQYYKGIASDLSLFTLVTKEQIPLLMAEIIKIPKLLMQTEDAEITLDQFNNLFYKGVNIRCVYDINSDVRASIKIKNPFGGFDINILIWEFLDITGNIKLAMGYIGRASNSEDELMSAKQLLSEIQSIKHGQKLTILTVTHINKEGIPDVDPFVLSITNNVSKNEEGILHAYENSVNTDIFPEGMERIIIPMFMYNIEK